MKTSSHREAGPSLIGLWLTLAVSLAYFAWLGVHWLPLGMNEHELAASASRVWDIKHEIVSRHLPCSPCFYYSSHSLHCVANIDYACAREISVDEVLAAVQNLLVPPRQDRAVTIGC